MRVVKVWDLSFECLKVMKEDARNDGLCTYLHVILPKNREMSVDASINHLIFANHPLFHVCMVAADALGRQITSKPPRCLLE